MVSKDNSSVMGLAVAGLGAGFVFSCPTHLRGRHCTPNSSRLVETLSPHPYPHCHSPPHWARLYLVFQWADGPQAWRDCTSEGASLGSDRRSLSFWRELELVCVRIVHLEEAPNSRSGEGKLHPRAKS